MALLTADITSTLPVVGADRAELNDLFDLAVWNQLNDDNVFRQLFDREPMIGNPTGIRVRTARNASRTMTVEPTTADALPDASFGNQGRLRVAEYAGIIRIGVAVSDYMIASAAGQGGIDVLMEELGDAVMDFRDLEEIQLFAIRSGIIAGESANNLVGLRHVLQDATPTPVSTDTLYGLDRTTDAETATLFSNAFYGATPGTPENISQAKLDAGLRAVRDDGGRVNLIITGNVQRDNLNNIFATRQRFNDTINVNAGFVVSQYRAIPIADSIHVPRTAGDTLVGTAAGNKGQDVFGLDMRYWKMKVLKEAQMTPIAKDGPANKHYMESYLQLICRKPNANFALYDLTETPV